ncbi:hypothetical protein [Burkholderia pseudomallei]|uniref:hypothetical protein n=1 Tax=Burkholderia pseudomallei TaxID=28450 RepID=UPI000F081B93|nr:hypothetical protein [Burkholderia pseudomallei]
MTLTTTQAHDVLVLLAVAEKPASGPPAVSTVTSTSGLTWNKRKAFTPTPGVTDIEVWWAYAPSAVTSEVITVTYNMTIDDFAGVAFGVNGCDQTSPWDPNSSLPQTATANGSAPALTGSTTNANTFVVMGIGTGNNAVGSYNTPPSGFTFIKGALNGGGLQYASAGVAYQRETSALSSSTFTWGAALSNTNGGGAFLDALQAPSGSPPPTSGSSPQLMIIT